MTSTQAPTLLQAAGWQEKLTVALAFSFQKNIAHVFRHGEAPAYKTSYCVEGALRDVRLSFGLGDKQVEINVNTGSLCHPCYHANAVCHPWVVYCGAGRFPNADLITPLPNDVATWFSHIRRPMPASFSSLAFRSAMVGIIAQGSVSPFSAALEPGCRGSLSSRAPALSPEEEVRQHIGDDAASERQRQQPQQRQQQPQQQQQQQSDEPQGHAQSRHRRWQPPSGEPPRGDAAQQPQQQHQQQQQQHQQQQHGDQQPQQQQRQDQQVAQPQPQQQSEMQAGSCSSAGASGDACVAEGALHVSRDAQPDLDHAVWFNELRAILDADHCGGTEERMRAIRNFAKSDATFSDNARKILAELSLHERFPVESQVIIDARRCAVRLLRDTLGDVDGITRARIRQYVYTQSTRILRHLWPKDGRAHDVPPDMLIFTPEGQADLIASIVRAAGRPEGLRESLAEKLQNQTVPKASCTTSAKRKLVEIATSRLKRAREFVQEGLFEVRPVIYDDIENQYGALAKDVWKDQCYDRTAVVVAGLEKTCADFVLESLRSGRSRELGVKNFRAASRASGQLRVRSCPGSWVEAKRAELLRKLAPDRCRTPSPSRDYRASGSGAPNMSA